LCKVHYELIDVHPTGQEIDIVSIEKKTANDILMRVIQLKQHVRSIHWLH